MIIASGTTREGKFLLLQNSCLDRLIEKSAMVFAWLKHHIVSELCDKEKLSDAFLVIGESHQKLRDFSKAIKWYAKVGKDTSQLKSGGSSISKN